MSRYEYKYDLIAEINELDIVLRRCFAHIIKAPEYCCSVSDCVDIFLQRIRTYEIEYVREYQITLRHCLGWHVHYSRPLEDLIKQDCYKIISAWLDDNLFRCDKCRRWRCYDEDDEHHSQSICDSCGRRG